MLIGIFIILFLCCLYVLSTACRRGNKDLSALLDWNYTHRGLHSSGAPENGLRAFQRSVEAGYGIEFDVHLLSDGNLAVIHDSDLVRVTGELGKVEDLTVDQLEDYKLCNTFETIPQFKQVLETVSGKVPLIIEMKVSGNNYATLCQAVCKALEGYEGPFCLESFDPRCIYWLRRHRPDLVRGQLTEDYIHSPAGKKIPWILRFLLKYQMLNFLVLPDFVAYRFRHRKNIGTRLIKKLWKVPLVAWPLTSEEEYIQAKNEGWIPIFENCLP